MTDLSQTLLDELEAIDHKLSEGDATPEQEARGQQLVHLADAAADLFDALEYFFNIMHDYECSVRKGYVQLALEQARTALAKAKGRA
jgi:hypothetical protein